MIAGRKIRRAVVPWLALGLLTQGLPARADEQTVELRSRGSYESYRLPDRTTEVELQQQTQGACRFNRTWGYDLSNKELWVNGGCGGRFKVITEAARNDDKSSNVGVAIAAAAVIAGVAILASKNRDKQDNNNNDGGWRPDPGNGWENHQIQSRAGGLCLDIEGSARPGNNLIVFDCHNAGNQRFEWSRRGELRVGGLCVDVADGNTDDGARVIAWQCNGQRNQRWRSEGGQIRSEATGKCLDLKEGRSRPKQPVIMWRCNGKSNQQWSW